MNKAEVNDLIIRFSMQYKIPLNQIFVMTGGALVLMNIMEETDDVDLIISKELYDTLPEDAWELKSGFFGQYKKSKNVKIEVSGANMETLNANSLARQDGLHIQTFADVFKMKKDLITYLEDEMYDHMIKGNTEKANALRSLIKNKKKKLTMFEQKLIAVFDSNIKSLTMMQMQAAAKCTCGQQQTKKSATMRPPKKGNYK